MSFTAGHIKITVSPDLTNFKDKIEAAVRDLEKSLNDRADRYAEQVRDAEQHGSDSGEAYSDGYNDAVDRRRADHRDRSDRDAVRRAAERGARVGKAEEEARQKETDKTAAKKTRRSPRTAAQSDGDNDAKLARSIANEKARAEGRRANSTERILSDARAKELARQMRREMREKLAAAGTSNVAPHDEEYYKDLVARQVAAMRRQVGKPVDLGAENGHLYQVEDDVKAGWKDRKRRVLRSDQTAITTATRAATTVDRDQQQYKTLLSQRAGIEQAVTSAAVARQRVEQSGSGDTAALASVNERLNRALDTRVNYYRRLGSAESRFSNSKQIYNLARNNLSNQSDRSTLLRGMERVNLGVGEKWDALNNKLIFMGRYLSSIGQIATTSAVSMAAFGAVNLMPLISALGQAMGSLAAMPAVITAAGAGLAAVIIGSKGIASAFKAAAQASKSSATDAEDAADQQADAIRQVTNAQDNLTVSRRDADRTAASGARSIASAEKAVQSALKNSTDAQKTLTQAREAAAEKIKSLNDALKGTALSERGAKLAQLRAEKNLWKVSADPTSDWLDIAEAVYSRDEASYNAEQAAKTNAKAHDDAATANAKGIEGDEAVIAAREALVQANERVAESQEQLVVIAQQVADANDDAQRRSRQAVESLNDALRNQQKVMRDLGKNGFAKKLQEELDRLSPSARDFVQQVRSLGSEWTSLRNSAEEALTNGLGPAFRDVATKHLPLMRVGFAAINNEINTGLKQSLSVFNTSAAQRDFATFLANTTGGFRGLAQAAGPMSKIFIDLTTAGSAVLPRLGQALATATQKMSDRVSAARETGELNLAIDRGIEKMKQFGHVIGNTFGGLRGFFQALRGDGDGLLGNLEKSTAKFEAWTKSAEGADKIRSVFTAINDKVDQLMGTVSALASAFSQLIGPVIDNFGFTLDIAQQVAEAIQSVVSAVMSFGPAAKVIEGVLTAFAALYTMKSLASTFDGIKSKVADAFTAIRNGATNARGHFRDISDSVRNTYDTVSNTERIRPGLSRMSGMVGGAFSGIQTAATKAFTGISNGVNSLVSSMGGWFTVGATAAIIAITSIMASADKTDRKIAELNKRTEEARQQGLKFKEDLNTQLGQSGGAITDEIKGTVLGSLQGYKSGLQDTIDDRSSGWDRTVSRFRTRHQNADGTWRRTDAEILNDNATAAQSVKDALAATGYTENQMVNALTGNQAKYDEFRNKLLAIKDGGKDAAAAMDDMRKKIIDSASSANAAKTAMEAIGDANRDAADAVKILTDALARQNKNWMTYEASGKDANDSIRQLQGLDLSGKGEVTITAEGVIDTKSEAGSALWDQLGDVKTAYDAQASSAYYAAKQAGKSEEDALAAARKATEGITTAVRQRISMYTSEETAIQNLLNHYGLAADSFQKQSTGKQNQPTFDPNAPVVAAAPADGTAQPPADGQNGQNGQPVIPAAGQNQGGQGQQVPAPDYTAASKALNDYNGVVTALKTALADAAAELGKLKQGLADVKDPTEQAKAPTEALGTAITGLKDSFAEMLGEKGALKSWGSLLTGIDSDITKLNSEILPKLTKALDPVETAFTAKVAAITTAFDGIRKGVASPIDWLITKVFDGGLKNAWNQVRAVLPTLPEWKGDYQTIGGYWRGGIIDGYTPGKDVKTIRVSGGEGILRPEVVKAVGAPWIHGMNAAAISGGIAGARQQYAGMSESFAGAFKTGGIVPSMESAINERFPGMQLTSGYRNEPGSFHSTGQAGDFSDGTTDTPAMQKLSAWIASNFLNTTLELIHSPFNHNIDNFKDVGDGNSVFGADTMAQHISHVHWALSQALGDVSGTTIPTGDWSAGSSAATGQIQQLLFQPLAKLRESMPKVGGSAMEQIPAAAYSTIMDALSTAVGKSQDAGTTPFDISAGVEQWRPNVIAALEREGWAADERNIRLMLAQIQTESSGNPNIIQQIKDINSGGNEGVGLLQIVPGTFAAYRNPALPNDRTNPDANLSAALRYYRGRYGNDLGTMWGQGHGYDEGGWLPHGGWGWNLSGKAEPVFTNDQWQVMTAQLSALASAVPGLDKISVPTGPSDFVTTLQKVVTAAAKAIKSLSTKSDEKTQTGQQQQAAPQTSPDSTGAGVSSGGSNASGKTNNADVTGTGGAAQVDPNTVAAAKDGLATGELDTAQVPADNPDGAITAAQPDPNSAARAGSVKVNADGTVETVSGDPNAPATDAPVTTEPNSGASGTVKNGTGSGTENAGTSESAEDQAYRTAAMTTRDPQHYKAIWDSALGTDGKGGGFFKDTWNQFTSDLGITGNGFLSQAYSASQDGDNQLNSVLKHEWNNSSVGKAVNTGVSNAQTAVQQGIAGAQKVVEEHIHYHVTNIDEALRKNAIRQQQNAAAFINR